MLLFPRALACHECIGGKNPTFECYHGLVYGYITTWSQTLLEERDNVVEEWLDFATSGSRWSVTNV